MTVNYKVCKDYKFEDVPTMSETSSFLFLISMVYFKTYIHPQ